MEAHYNILRENTDSFNDKIFREGMPFLIRKSNKTQKCILVQGDYFFSFVIFIGFLIYFPEKHIHKYTL